MGCMEWMQLQKKKQGQTNFFEIHLTLLHIFYVLFHSDTWMSLGGTRTSILFKLDFVTAFLCTFIVNFSTNFMNFICDYFHYFYLCSLITS